MTAGLFVCFQISAGKDGFFQTLHFFFQSGRQYRKTHNLNQADVFFLDVVQVAVRMVHTQRMFFCGDVVTQYQIQFIFVSTFSGDRCDGVMRFSICFRKDKGIFVCITTPIFQKHISAINQTMMVFMGNTDNGHRPFHNAHFHIFKTLADCFPFHFCPFHSKSIPSTLEMVMGQDRTAYDSQVCVGAYKVMRQEVNEIEHFRKSVSVNLHRYMLSIKHNAVFVVIHIGGILEKPVISRNAQRNDAVVFSGGMVHPTCIAFVFPTKHTFGITALRSQFRCRNGFGVFFRLRQVNGDVDFTVFCHGFPTHILFDAVSADVVCITAKVIIPVCCFFRVFCMKFTEFPNDFSGKRCHNTHEFCVEQIFIYDAVRNQFPFAGIFQQNSQNGFQIGFRFACGFFISIQFHFIYQTVDDIRHIRFCNQPCSDAIERQISNCFIYHIFPLSQKPLG